MICFAQVANKCSLDCILLKLWHINEICKTADAVQWENIHPPKLEHTNKQTTKIIWIDFNFWLPVRWSARDMKMIYILLSRNICAVNVWCMIRIGFSQGLSLHDHQNIYKCKNFLHCLDNLPARTEIGKYILNIFDRFAPYSWTSSVSIVAPLPSNDNTWMPYQNWESF